MTVAARRPRKLEAAAAELRAAGIEAEAVPANMADEEEIKALVSRHRERFGRLDVLVNNAASESAARSRTPRPRSSTSSST